jgi:hypothetical protein
LRRGRNGACARENNELKGQRCHTDRAAHTSRGAARGRRAFWRSIHIEVLTAMV